MANFQLANFELQTPLSISIPTVEFEPIEKKHHHHGHSYAVDETTVVEKAFEPIEKKHRHHGHSY